MFGYVRFQKDGNDEDRITYRCSRCGAFITDSHSLIRIQGTREHSFVNPAGIHCNFKTFSHCENIAVDSDLYLQHSWFRGYGWRFVMCRMCMQHLGWRYDAVPEGGKPRSFFGILVENVESIPRDD